MESRYSTERHTFKFDDDPMEDTEAAYWSCLCTFPFNHERSNQTEMSSGMIANLALLGAAVATSYNQPSKINTNYGEALPFPYCLPFWMRKQIYEFCYKEPYPFIEVGII